MQRSRSQRPLQRTGRRVSMIAVLAFGAGGAALACGSSARLASSPGLPPRPLPRCAATTRPVPRDTFPVYGGPRPPEYLTIRVSRKTPGGLTSIEGGPTARLVLQMVDTSQADTARAALSAAFAAEGDPAFAARVRDAAVRPVAFSAADLVDWHAYISGLLFNEASRDRVTISGIGVDFHRAYVVVAVPGEAERTWVEARLAHANLPCGLVQTELGAGLTTGRAPRDVHIRP